MQRCDVEKVVCRVPKGTTRKAQHETQQKAAICNKWGRRYYQGQQEELRAVEVRNRRRAVSRK